MRITPCILCSPNRRRLCIIIILDLALAAPRVLPVGPSARKSLSRISIIKFFVLFIIRNQNIGSTSHSWRVRRTPFLLRLLTHWFHNAKVCAVFFLPKKRGTAGSSTKWRRLRTDWGREFHTVLMTRQCATAPIWLVVRRGKFASAKVRHATRECELLITGQEIAGLKEGLGVVVLAL